MKYRQVTVDKATKVMRAFLIGEAINGLRVIEKMQLEILAQLWAMR